LGRNFFEEEKDQVTIFLGEKGMKLPHGEIAPKKRGIKLPFP
jgi:hypothetical protein